VKIAAGGLQAQIVQEVSPVKTAGFVQEGKKQENAEVGAATSYSVENTNNLDEIVKKLNTALELYGYRVSFKIHEETKKLMVSIIDDKTGEVIKEIPPKKMLDVEAAISKMIGLILDEHI